jgi:hypothetical protein
MKTVSVSKERVFEMGKEKTREIVSFFPYDKWDCECVDLVKETRSELEKMAVKDRVEYMRKQGVMECPHSKTGKKKYFIKCNVCRELQGYCWASSDKLIDYSDFHYIQWHDKKQWHGFFAPHISPIDGRLCFECCCGNDTRDFRANMQLPTKIAEAIEEKNAIGREFGKVNSKFEAVII